MNKCLFCETETDNPKFCSRSCSASYNNGSRGKCKRICLFCHKEFESYPSSNTKFCSMICSGKYTKNKLINGWLSGASGSIPSDPQSLKVAIRNYLLEQSNYRCSICEWGIKNPFTDKYPLEIDHIDGDTLNNRPENLRVLCPNCHSLTEFHGILNKGRGRRKYRELYRAGK